MKVHFDKLLQEQKCSVGDLIDLNIAPISPFHNLQCDILDWTCHPSQVLVKDIKRSYLDGVSNMGGGWDPTDVESHFGPITISSAKRETSQQEKCVRESMKNNAEELVIKESLNQIKLKRGSRKKKIYVCTCNFDHLFVKYADANTRYADLSKTEEFEASPAIVT